MMNDYSGGTVTAKMPSATVVAELNNNSEHVLDGIYRPRSESRASTISSASSSNEISEDMELPDVCEETETAPDKNTNECEALQEQKNVTGKKIKIFLGGLTVMMTYQMYP